MKQLSLQEFPDDLLSVDYADPNDPNKTLHYSEVERRVKYFHLLKDILVKGEDHPLAQLSKDCLNNDPNLRPIVEQVLAALEDMEEEVEGPYGEFSRLDAIRQVAAMKALIIKDVEVKEKANELMTKNNKINQLQEKLEHTQKVFL